ncbi:MAG: C40 family peptidase [Schwartzia sp.]|nr:C40 family peptidase [Schwartzia sp. (in: firmicutes)]
MTAVEQYQNMHFLPVTGQVDETTIMRMFGQSDIPSTYTSGLGNEWFPILLLKTAESFIGVPYVWGGDSPSGFDCSGFIQYVFQQMGLKLPRTADEQFNYGYIVQKDQLLPGDLVFFETYEPGPSHVGIYYNAHYFIHADSAAGMITFDTLDRAYREETFLGGRRMFLW